jgi:hypothetical protein
MQQRDVGVLQTSVGGPGDVSELGQVARRAEAPVLCPSARRESGARTPLDLAPEPDRDQLPEPSMTIFLALTAAGAWSGRPVRVRSTLPYLVLWSLPGLSKGHAIVTP